jgi:hypothetical protein
LDKASAAPLAGLPIFLRPFPGNNRSQISHAANVKAWPTGSVVMVMAALGADGFCYKRY